MAFRTRAIAVLGIAAIVVAGGLLAGLRGGGASTTPPAAPSAVRATLDPVTSLTGDATQVSELQSRLALHPANARLQGDLGIAYLQRARETNDPSYYTKAHTLLNRSLTRDPGGLDATVGEGSLALSYHDFPRGAATGQARPRALTRILAPGARHDRRRLGGARALQAGLRCIRAARPAAPGLVAYARLSYSRELQGDVAGATGSCAARSTPARARPRTRSGRACSWRRCCSSRATPTPPPRSTTTRSRCCPTTRAPRPASAPSPSLAATCRWRRGGTSARPRTCRCPTSWRSSATCGRRAATTRAPRRPTRSWASRTPSSSAAGGNADLETGAVRRLAPGRSRARPAVALARKALAFRPSVYGHDALGWALYRGRQLPRGAAGGEAREPPRHASTRCSRATSARSRPAPASATWRARRCTKALARTPHFHPLDGPAARRTAGEARSEAAPRRPDRRASRWRRSRLRSRWRTRSATSRSTSTRGSISRRCRVGALRARHGRDPDVAEAADRRRQRRRAHLRRRGRA